MKRNSEINDLCRQIVDGFKPEKVILFGSHARGSETKDSDVDFLVVMPFKGRSVDQAIKIRRAITTRLPLDLLVRTPKQIKKRVDMEDFFIREILNSGKVLYEAGR